MPNAPPATVVSPAAVVIPEASELPVTPDPGTDAALVALITPVPVADNEAPEPTTIAALLLVLLVKAENAIDGAAVALMVTAPVPPVGDTVTLVPAITRVTPPPNGAAHAATYAPVAMSVLAAHACVGAVGAPVSAGEASGAAPVICVTE